ncbi:hypothetical protein GCM10009000_013350 [Halobacterium noricense]|uniref:Putative sensor domain-containing protein n=2 Tax=Haladaptatus pallidirubidus TaxID=1008152 RepID=A0AAV3UBH9_9EURY
MFPLGILYFTVLTTGVLTGLPLVIIVVGIPILVLCLALVVGFTGLERILVRLLLGVEIPSSEADFEGIFDDKAGKTIWIRGKRLVTNSGTWKGVAYLLSEFVYGTVVFGLLSSLMATIGSFLLAPLYYEEAPVSAYGPIPSDAFTLDILFGWDNLLVGLTTTFQLGSWRVETLLGALFVSAVGMVLLLISLQLFNALAGIWGRYARIMLS